MNAEKLNKENRLDYLEFNQCERSHYFDGNTRTVYMEITPADYQKQIKEYDFFSRENNHQYVCLIFFQRISIYMFNFYQSATLNKRVIEQQKFDQCKLAFWFAIKQNDEYIPISNKTLSDTITEGMIF